ncbi:MAG: hypothetical protein A3D92_05265 [Bacteroidetes bacterium RIFCSPHIGHO2_02_FULL_44_7]|nr:MAG: hypothetical protein A3D92_05265 [Bacteroidetes bacterium RIFCSPHIGHO2_02_FULL_44_7]
MSSLIVSIRRCLLFLMLNSMVVYGQMGNDTIVDRDGNLYHSVTIGSQIWMVENLKVRHYRNGDTIAMLSESEPWENTTSGAFCRYSLTDFHLSTEQEQELNQYMGNLYNGFCILDERNIAPLGWHIPTVEEWEILCEFLGGKKVAGGKLKDSLNWRIERWFNPNKVLRTNETGFTALPDGGRKCDGTFLRLSEEGHLASVSSKGNIMYGVLSYLKNEVYFLTGELCQGFSVRCIKDE